MLNSKSITIGIISNKKKSPTSYNSNYKIFLKPVSISIQDFKNAFYPCNYFKPNEFVNITNIDYYTICTYKDSSSNCLDACGNCLDACGNCLDACGNCLDACGNCLDVCGKPLSLYTQSLSIFMDYNGILCENTIEPRYLISFTNEVFRYINFKDIPKIVTSMYWISILDWLDLSTQTAYKLYLNIELHYYDENFMPDPVIYVFQYQIN